ncbi:MAG: hypothetical protein K6E59_02550 [Bacilli bacterium]|nr:hypothetical protein [Bacilli bacterium]
MYCTHCAKHIDEAKLEAKQSSFALVEGEIDENAKIAYVCPRCGHLVHDGIDEEETKSLSRAAHAQVQRARNYFASGMGMVSLGAILLAIAILFFVLAHKPTNGYTLFDASGNLAMSAEFLVSVILGLVSVILLATGGVFVVHGVLTKKRNTDLLRDINNGTFVQ